MTKPATAELTAPTVDILACLRDLHAIENKLVTLETEADARIIADGHIYAHWDDMEVKALWQIAQRYRDQLLKLYQSALINGWEGRT